MSFGENSQGYVDKRNQGLNRAPLVYQFREHNLSATDGARITRKKCGNAGSCSQYVTNQIQYVYASFTVRLLCLNFHRKMTINAFEIMMQTYLF